MRFTDQVSEQTHIADDRRYPAGEIQNDRMLTQYDTIIIDEAHERSLNIDFIWAISNSCCQSARISR